MDEKSIREEIRQEISILRDVTIPRVFTVVEEKFDKIENYLKDISNKFNSLDKEHTATKTKVDTLWWVCGITISGIIYYILC